MCKAAVTLRATLTTDPHRGGPMPHLEEFLSILRSLWECETKGCANVDASLSLNATAVEAYDALHRRQSDPRPGKFARRMESLKRHEQLARVSHVKSST